MSLKALRKAVEREWSSVEARLLSNAGQVTPVLSAHLEARFQRVVFIVPSAVSTQVKQGIKTVVRSLRPGWESYTRTAYGYPYSTHAYEVDQRSIDVPEEIVLYDIPLSSLRGLAEAYEVAAELAAKSDRVACFAAGGVPLMVYLTDQQVSSEGERAACRAKYHLFGGLNWTPTSTKDAFRNWLRNQLGNNLLLVDTGTSGNGVRQILGDLESVVPECTTTGDCQVTILGVVDGHDSHQISVVTELVTRTGGRVRVEVKYHHVERVLTEDCQALLGYDPQRSRALLRPLRTLALFRITGEMGPVGSLVEFLLRSTPLNRWSSSRRALLWLLSRLTPFYVAASKPASGGLKKLLEKSGQSMTRRSWYSREVHNSTAWLALEFGRQEILEELGAVVAMGIVTSDHQPVLQRGIDACFERARDRYPSVMWDWDSKRKRAVLRPETKLSWPDDLAGSD